MSLYVLPEEILLLVMENIYYWEIMNLLRTCKYFFNFHDSYGISKYLKYMYGDKKKVKLKNWNNLFKALEFNYTEVVEYLREDSGYVQCYHLGDQNESFETKHLNKPNEWFFLNELLTYGFALKHNNMKLTKIQSKLPTFLIYGQFFSFLIIQTFYLMVCMFFNIFTNFNNIEKHFIEYMIIYLYYYLTLNTVIIKNIYVLLISCVLFLLFFPLSSILSGIFVIFIFIILKKIIFVMSQF